MFIRLLSSSVAKGFSSRLMAASALLILTSSAHATDSNHRSKASEQAALNETITIEQLMQNRNQILEQLTDTMHHLATLMEKHEMMDHNHLQDVAKAINQLSDNLKELSQKIEQSRLDSQSYSSLKKKNDQLNEETERLLLQFNDN